MLLPRVHHGRMLCLPLASPRLLVFHTSRPRRGELESCLPACLPLGTDPKRFLKPPRFSKKLNNVLRNTGLEQRWM
jgi:hypothetical protein